MSSEEDIVIARVVLGGWRIEIAAWSPAHNLQYRLLDPRGRLRSVHGSRYTAALRAEDIMEGGFGGIRLGGLDGLPA